MNVTMERLNIKFSGWVYVNAIEVVSAPDMMIDVHYNIYHYPRGQKIVFPGDMSLGILFPGDMLSLYIRCSTDELICYRCTLDVQRMNHTLTITTTNRSHTLLPSQPPTDQTIIMVLMVPYEVFAYPCGAEDVVLRESYKPNTREERVRLLVGSPGASTYSPGSSSTLVYSPGPSTPPRYSPRASTPQSYSRRTSRNAECSNCKHLLGKITPRQNTFGCDLFMERGTSPSTGRFSWSFNYSNLFSGIFINSNLFSGIFNTSTLFFKSFNTSKLFSENFKKCRVLKPQALAWKDNGTRGNNGNVYASGTTHIGTISRSLQ
nr:malectin/receptor-like protein kinase family protein [Tanacetum cinerariifolium]